MSSESIRRAAYLQPAVSAKERYEHNETFELVTLVTDAAERIRAQGEAAFEAFRVSGSRWRRGETYVFVLDLDGNMRVHPDPELEGKNELALKDLNGKPIIEGLIDAATAYPGKPEGWYHYQWPVPGGLLPRWKSSYVRLVTAPSGERFVVGAGLYNDRMERAFVVDVVLDALALIERKGEAAFSEFRDVRGPFIAKDAYIFVFDSDGVDLVNPGFPSLEGRNLLDLKDTQGKTLIREMMDVVQVRGYGWVDYMWPKPGESVSTRKSAFVSRAKVGKNWYLVGCGVYLADAPRLALAEVKMSASELVSLVREGAALLEEKGEAAYPELRMRGSKWFTDDTYFFAWTTEGNRVFHAADPTIEGEDISAVKDSLGRPYGKMILELGASYLGEGWVHYMYPRPGEIFPAWKSTFVKRAVFPSGREHIIGCGIYNMKMDKVFIEDIVNRAANVISDRGRDAFPRLRDKTGSFVFMDTYVFVESPDGTELVNPVFPNLEGENLIDLKDVNGKSVIREQIDAAMKEGRAWLECDWYRPGTNTPASKLTFVRKVRSGEETYIVGSGLYLD